MKSARIVSGIFISLTLQGCEQAVELSEAAVTPVSQAEYKQFIKSVKDNLVFVDGGEFLMGDFGPQYAPERAPYDRDQDSKPLHKVELSSYSINKFKVINAEFQFYLRYKGLKLRAVGMASKSKWDNINSIPDTPAHIDWYEADQYCDWLASVTQLPFALPTEAQWEYAARSRGQFLMVATDDGTYKAEPRSSRTKTYSPKGINISNNGDRMAFAKEMGWKTKYYTPLPVGEFPPNPLGLYSMSDNGYEWVKDWYDPDYYKYSPLKDPQGPEIPIFKDTFGRFTKVMRGQGYADPYWGGGVNVHRTQKDPFGRSDKEGSIYIATKTMRCVVNSPEPVTASLLRNEPDAESSGLKDR